MVANTQTTPISHVLVYSGGLITPLSIGLKNQLAFFNQPSQPQQGVTHLPAKKLLLVLSSWGGNLFEVRSLYDLMRSVPYEIEVHATGTIKSAALQLMLAADRRTAAPGTTFLFHPWTWGTEIHPGHSSDSLQQLPLQLEDDIAWGKSVIAQRTKLTAENIQQMALFDKARIEDAKFALKHGIVHEVGERKMPPGVMTWNVTG